MLLAVILLAQVPNFGPYVLRGLATPACPAGVFNVRGAGGEVVMTCAGPRPSPQPSPTPTPRPSPTPSPRPSPYPSPNGANFPPPPAGTCPAGGQESYDVLPSRVGIGEGPSVSFQGNRTVYNFFLSSKSVQPYCGHQPDRNPCEQWMPCAQKQDRIDGHPPMLWFSRYPGTGCSETSWNVDDCQVERPSRECDAREKADDAAHGLDPGACRRPNGFAGRDVKGVNGGPPGLTGICAAPWGRPELRSCHIWDLQLNGWRLVQ